MVIKVNDEWTEMLNGETVIREAGNRYSFRPDELLMFIARGFEARLQILESAYEQHFSS